MIFAPIESAKSYRGPAWTVFDAYQRQDVFIPRHFGLMMTGIAASFASTRQRRRIGTHS